MCREFGRIPAVRSRPLRWAWTTELWLRRMREREAGYGAGNFTST